MKKVLIGGGFDLIHTGHIFRIKATKSFGDYLIVNITPDNRMKRKGEGRPVLSQKERMVIVENIKGVDEVICVESKGEEHFDYEIKYIKKAKPDIFLTEKWDKKLEKFCDKRGIELYIWGEFEGLDKVHSSDIINKIKGR